MPANYVKLEQLKGANRQLAAENDKLRAENKELKEQLNTGACSSTKCDQGCEPEPEQSVGDIIKDALGEGE